MVLINNFIIIFEDVEKTTLFLTAPKLRSVGKAWKVALFTSIDHYFAGYNR